MLAATSVLEPNAVAPTVPTHAELAKSLNVPRSTVTKQLNRGLSVEEIRKGARLRQAQIAAGGAGRGGMKARKGQTKSKGGGMEDRKSVV